MQSEPGKTEDVNVSATVKDRKKCQRGKLYSSMGRTNMTIPTDGLVDVIFGVLQRSSVVF